MPKERLTPRQRNRVRARCMCCGAELPLWFTPGAAVDDAEDDRRYAR